MHVVEDEVQVLREPEQVARLLYVPDIWSVTCILRGGNLGGGRAESYASNSSTTVVLLMVGYSGSGVGEAMLGPLKTKRTGAITLRNFMMAELWVSVLSLLYLVCADDGNETCWGGPFLLFMLLLAQQNAQRQPRSSYLAQLGIRTNSALPF